MERRDYPSRKCNEFRKRKEREREKKKKKRDTKAKEVLFQFYLLVYRKLNPNNLSKSNQSKPISFSANSLSIGPFLPQQNDQIMNNTNMNMSIPITASVTICFFVIHN